jgi:hypothetical protein
MVQVLCFSGFGHEIAYFAIHKATILGTNPWRASKLQNDCAQALHCGIVFLSKTAAIGQQSSLYAIASTLFRS